MSAGVPEVEVENLTVIDSKNGGGVTKMASFLEQLRQATGVDVVKIAGHLADGQSTHNSNGNSNQ